MQTILVKTIRDIQPFILCKWVRIDSLSRSYRVFPFLLHLGVHDQERIVRQVDANLALRIGQ
jgi:hypothetical protein